MARILSLTRELRTTASPVRRFLAAQFPRIDLVAADFARQLDGATPITPPRTEPPASLATLGTAIDYRLRYAFRVTPYRRLTAFGGARWLAAGGSRFRGATVMTPLYQPKGTWAQCSIPQVAHDLFLILESFLSVVPPVGRRLAAREEARLCRYCYGLALFDGTQYASASQLPSPLAALIPTSTVNELLALIQPSWVDDLCQMAQRFFDGYQAITETRAVVDPHFSYSVMGASADLLVDGCLVDFKASTQTRLDPIWLYQLLGYTLLDFDHSLGIHSIGVYMARHGVLVRWSLETLLPMLMGLDTAALDELRRRFRTFLGA